MDLHRFIRQNRECWQELSALLDRAASKGLPALTGDEVRRYSALYRRAASHLAYSRLHYPDAGLTRELEDLVGRAHSRLYRGEPLDVRKGLRFLTDGFPALVRRRFAFVALSATLFGLGVVIGIAATSADQEFAHLIVPPGIRSSVESGTFWPTSITAVKPLASSAIWRNNVVVALFAYALGVSAGIGTIYLLVFNGVLLGSIFVYCLHYGLADDLGYFVAAHGALEIPAIIIAGAAGLVMASGILLPGDRPRREHLWLRAREGTLLVVGCIPLLFIAALFEAFVSPLDLNGADKIIAGIALFVLLCAYLRFAGRRDGAPRSAEPDGNSIRVDVSA